MKRASLSALPARPQPEPADLTDRLLAREAGQAPEAAAPPSPAMPVPAPKAPARRRAAAAKKTAAPAATSEMPVAAAEITLDGALQQASAAAEALRQAAQGAPARYELAVRYRLQALAHHLQQVTDFIAGRASEQ